MEKIVLKGDIRVAAGTRGARRARQAGWVPANLYGHGEPNVNFQVEEVTLRRLVQEGHHMMTLDLGGKQEDGLLKELQFDTYGDIIVHADFARVSLEDVIEVNIPVVLEGLAKGVAQGGVLDILHHEVALRGKARDIPEHITIQVDDLELGQAVRARQLMLPAGVEPLLDPEDPIVIVHVQRTEAAPVAGGAGASEPEVVGRKEPSGEKKEG